MSTQNNPSPTNRWVGEKIGYSESGASLLRRGLRTPTLPLMRLVAQNLGWPVEEQVKSTETPRGWVDEFDRKTREAHALEATTKKENDQ